MKAIFNHKKLSIKNPVYALINVDKIKGVHPDLEKLKDSMMKTVLGYSNDQLNSKEVYLSYKELQTKSKYPERFQFTKSS